MYFRWGKNSEWARFARPGLVVNALIFLPGLHYGVNTDFLGLYSGARLAGTAAVYNPAALLAEQRLTTAFDNPHRLFIRPPFVAALLHPVSRLPYPVAFGLFEAFQLVCCIAFVFLWKIPSQRAAAIACCWSMPLFGSLVIGQDVPFVLLLVAVSYLLVQSQRDLAGGLVFSLALIKPHLFLLIPIWIIINRLWRFALGLGVGCLVLFLLGFVGAGPHAWAAFFQATQISTASPSVDIMPNLHGMTNGHLPLECTCACAVVALSIVTIRRASVDWGLATALAGSLLISHHAYIADCALLLLAAVLVLDGSGRSWQRASSLAILSPLYVALFLKAPLNWLAWGGELLFLAALATLSGNSCQVMPI